MNGKQGRSIPGFALVAVALACIPLIFPGPQAGDSLYTNLSWGLRFTEQLLAGEWYPRWLIGLNAGAGSPVFFYYAPLPFYVVAAASLVCAGCSPVEQLGIAEVFIVLGSALSFAFYARRFAGPRSAALASVLYALAPYHFAMDVLRRQALGEACAYVAMPLALYFADRLSGGRRAVIGLAIAYAAMVLSHLPATLLFSPFLLAYAVWRGGQSTTLFRRLAEPGLAIALGIALSAIYLLPALLERSAISMAQLFTAYYEYHRWFFFDGVDSPNQRLSDMLLLMLVVTTIAPVLAWALTRKAADQAHSARMRISMLFTLGAWLLVTPLSSPIWKMFPVLQNVQFPWRVILVVDLAAAIGVAVALERLLRLAVPLRLLGLAAIAAPLALSLGLSAWTYAGAWGLRGDAAHQAMIQSWLSAGEDTDEYIPAGGTRKRAELIADISTLPKLAWDAGHGNVSATVWRARHIELEADLNGPTPVVVRQFQYVGWRARIAQSGEPVELSRDANGLMVVRLPAGRHRIELELEPLKSERIGAAISATVLLAMLLALIRRRGRPA